MITTQAPWTPTWETLQRPTRHVHWWQEVLIALGVVALVLVGYGVWNLASQAATHASASYHQGYWRGTAGATIAQSDASTGQPAQDANQWCASFSPPSSIDRSQFTQGCLDGFNAR
jgi:hypothetical protein